jgi:hypothetical protein
MRTRFKPFASSVDLKKRTFRIANVLALVLVIIKESVERLFKMHNMNLFKKGMDKDFTEYVFYSGDMRIFGDTRMLGCVTGQKN